MKKKHFLQVSSESCFGGVIKQICLTVMSNNEHVLIKKSTHKTPRSSFLTQNSEIQDCCEVFRFLQVSFHVFQMLFLEFSHSSLESTPVYFLDFE